MQKNILNNQNGNAAIIAVVVLVIIIGGFFFFQSNNKSNVKDDAMMQENKMVESDDHDNNDAMMEDNNNHEDTTMKDDSNDTMMEEDKKDDNMIEEDKMMNDSDDSMTKQPGKYIKYSKSDYDAAKDQKRVLFFHAGWCPTCFVANRNFEKNLDRIPEGVVLFKTDYDKEVDLKKKYNVTYQHTFVQVDADGNEVAKWNGGSIDELIKNIL